MRSQSGAQTNRLLRKETILAIPVVIDIAYMTIMVSLQVMTGLVNTGDGCK